MTTTLLDHYKLHFKQDFSVHWHVVAALVSIRSISFLTDVIFWHPDSQGAIAVLITPIFQGLTAGCCCPLPPGCSRKCQHDLPRFLGPGRLQKGFDGAGHRPRPSQDVEHAQSPPSHQGVRALLQTLRLRIIRRCRKVVFLDLLPKYFPPHTTYHRPKTKDLYLEVKTQAGTLVTIKPSVEILKKITNLQFSGLSRLRTIPWPSLPLAGCQCTHKRPHRRRQPAVQTG